MIRRPVVPVMSATTWWSWRFYLGQRLLHVLDMRCCVLKQTLALTHVGPQLGDLAFGPKAGTQQPVRMKPLQPLRIADVGLSYAGVWVTRSIRRRGEPAFR